MVNKLYWTHEIKRPCTFNPGWYPGIQCYVMLQNKWFIVCLHVSCLLCCLYYQTTDQSIWWVFTKYLWSLVTFLSIFKNTGSLKKVCFETINPWSLINLIDANDFLCKFWGNSTLDNVRDAKPTYFRGRLPIFVNIFVHFDTQFWQAPYFWQVLCHWSCM